MTTARFTPNLCKQRRPKILTKRKTTRSNAQKSQQIRSKSAGTSRQGPVRKGPAIRKKKHTSLYLVGGILALIAIIIGGFVLIQRLQTTQASTTPGGGQLEPLDSTVFQEVIGVSQTTWKAIGTGGMTQPFSKTTKTSPLKGANSLPEFLYIGGEYCPNCAAERWAILNALSRFGTFSKISQIHSAEENISTLSFEDSSYTSQYVDFVPREINGNVASSSGGYTTLDTLTADQQQIFNGEDSEGDIPFIDVGNHYKLIGANYEYTTLEDSNGNPLSWQDIASSLSQTNSPIAQAILGAANYLTAAICSVDGQQPGSVCQISAIQQIEQALSQIPSLVRGTAPTNALLDTAILAGTPRRLSRVPGA